MTDYKIEHQADQHLFFIALDGGQRAHLRYELSSANSTVNSVDFHSTFVPETYRGKGLAADLVERGFEWAEQENLEIKTSCWYAAKLYQKRTAS